ncbi:glycoside hydrolase family 2 TIM barrel-domain containing protein [Abyssalbus ytuae]|uniref:Cellulase family glycosylhydrolase n=1 Tax=Abyssalbus ytuae TaxID=2926907 RepID=A0A9E6ZWI6_9FLAO|nr:glycoside hydrolase family 2 TIM barrel-domain containing protein [Abyssalbus ytuae]UOB19063.1 cellulase family glycosylhydrolase [Abyssalbus ytuae]
MHQKININIYRALLLLSFILLNILIVYGISSVLSYLNTGADRSAMLHLPSEGSNIYLPEVLWGSLENPGREIEKETLKKLEKDYLNAWYVKNIAYQNNNLYGIKDYYTDSAQTNIKKTVEFNKKNNIFLESTTLRHHPILNFYSADGQLAEFTDENVEEYHKLYKNNQVIFETTQTSTYKVLMLLEDGFWRIRHMVKQEPTAKTDSVQAIPYARVKNNSIFINDEEYNIKGINYYPQETPWNTFGNNFNIQVLEKDFELIRSAGLNTIRIFIQYDDFGKANVAQNKLQKLKKVLDIAEKNSLKVIVTLFDFYGDYSINNWTLTHRHAKKIVSEFKDHKAILAWDIKNEPDLDFENRGKQNVLKWLEFIIKEVKRQDSNHLVTIGWSSTKAALYLKEKVDYVSFHYYLNDFEEDYSSLKNQVPNKPLVLEEFGISSYKGIWSPFGKSKKQQAEYHQTMQAIFKKRNIAYLSWTLYDFENIPPSVVGNLPWRKNKQKHFGFIDKNGNKKPSFLYISGQ